MPANKLILLFCILALAIDRGLAEDAEVVTIKNKLTHKCLGAPAEALSGSPLVFLADCTSVEAQWISTSTYAQHVQSQMCIAFSPAGFDDEANLPLVLTSDCGSASVPLILTNTATLQDGLNNQLCVQANGGVANEGTPAVMSPSCIPIVSLQFWIAEWKSGEPSPSPVPEPEPSPSPEPRPSPSPAQLPSCNTCFTIVQYFTPLTTNQKPTPLTCQAMAMAVNSDNTLASLVDPAPLVFTCTKLPKENSDGNFMFKICASGDDSTASFVDQVSEKLQLYMIIMTNSVALDCDLSVTLANTCGSQDVFYDNGCKKKPVKRLF